LKPEVRNSRCRRQTGCTRISASIQDSQEIQTAICMFLGSRNSAALLVMLYFETGSEKFKIAAAETGCTCISASIQDSEEIPTAVYMFLRSANSIMPSGRLHLETGSNKFKIAAAKPDVPLSQLLYKVAKKFHPVFSGSENSMMLWRRIHLETGSQKFKMAAPSRMYVYFRFYTKQQRNFNC
jgi:hypothetical protein